MKRIRRHYIFSGRVQGVGFRYRAFHLASALGLTGWIRNLPDDRVEMEVQGEEHSVFSMVAKLHEGTFIYITDTEAEDRPMELESSFHIRD